MQDPVAVTVPTEIVDRLTEYLQTEVVFAADELSRRDDPRETLVCLEEVIPTLAFSQDLLNQLLSRSDGQPMQITAPRGQLRDSFIGLAADLESDDRPIADPRLFTALAHSARTMAAGI